MRTIFFATTNNFKLQEANQIFAECKINIKPIELKIVEPQSIDLVEISRFKANEAFEILNAAVIVDDSGLFVPRINNFPGTLTSPIMKMLTIADLCKLLVDGEDVLFRTLVTYNDGKQMITESGEVRGMISLSRKNNASLLSDLFIPAGQSSKTLTEMALEGTLSHRRIALKKLLSELTKNGKQDD